MISGPRGRGKHRYWVSLRWHARLTRDFFERDARATLQTARNFTQGHGMLPRHAS